MRRTATRRSLPTVPTELDSTRRAPGRVNVSRPAWRFEIRWKCRDGNANGARALAHPGPASSARQDAVRISRMRAAVSEGVVPTRTPAASSASFLAAAVPTEPDTIAPAWPMVLPSGASKPAT